jgi:APA family basic amino acid/polyamine antiporter
LSVKSSEQMLFVRNSSGLVKGLGLGDVFVMNFGYLGASFSVSFAFIIAQSLWAFPKGSLVLGLIIGVLLCAPGVTLAYALMSAAIPRAGGDYVYISRYVAPWLGFMTNFALLIMLFFFVAWGAFWGGAQSLASVLATLGYILKASWLTHAGTWVAGKPGEFTVGTVLIVIFVLLSGSRIRLFAQVLRVMFIIGLVGTLAGIVVLAVASHGAFVAHFNAFVASLNGTHHYYQTVINQAAHGGTPLGGFSFAATLAMLPIIAFSTIFSLSSAYLGSEVRGVRKSQLWGMPAALIIAGILDIVVFVLLQHVVGHQFLVASQTLWYNGQLSALPIFPFFNLFATVASGNALVAVVVGLGYLMMSLLFIPVQIAISTRMIFAYAFDRLIPDKFAEVNDRTNSPLYALIPVFVVSTGFLAILVFTTWFTTLSGSAGLYPCMILACVAAVVLAYRSEEFRSSPVGKIRIGRVPLIVPAGILGICFLTGVFIAYLMDSAYGVNSTTSLALIGCSLGAGLIIFIVSYFIRRSRGVNLSQIYRQIPPM